MLLSQWRLKVFSSQRSRSVSNLIVARFDDAHTAFLARAALARLQKELPLHGQDFAVVTREQGGVIVLQKPVMLGAEQETHPTFWETLVGVLFGPERSAGANDDSKAADLAAIGIDATFGSHFVEQLGAESSALLVLSTGPVTREKVFGVLRGFQGEVVQTELKGQAGQLDVRSRGTRGVEGG